MDKHQVETTQNPEVIVISNAKLRVIGWDRNEVAVKAANSEDVNIQQDGDHVQVEVTSKCKMHIPHGANLQIQVVQDDAYVKAVHGAVVLQQASSDVFLRDVGPVEINYIGGDLDARNVKGLAVTQVGGFVRAKSIAGDFSSEHVGAHLTLKDVAGDVTAKVDGNANLVLNPEAEHKCTVKTRGVLNCHVPTELNAQVNISSQGPITVKVGDVRQGTLDGKLNLSFGDGAATLDLSANGPVALLGEGFGEKKAFTGSFDFDFSFAENTEDWANMGDEIAGQVTQQLDAQMEVLSAHLDNLGDHLSMVGGVSDEKAQAIAQRAQARAERAREKIQRAAKRAQERTARKMARAQQREARAAKRKNKKSKHKRSWEFGGRTTPASDPVSDEERMLILQMLADGKVTTDQAENLLAALEGKSE